MNCCFKTVFNRALGVWQTTSELTTVAGKTSNKAVAVVVFGVCISANSMVAGAIDLPTAGNSYDISGLGNQTINTLSGVSDTTVSLGANTLTLGDNSNQSYAGLISGSGALVKTGAGVQTLGGANTFGGGVTVNAGGLVVGNNAALGTGALTIGGATTLDASGAVALANNVVLNAGLTALGSNNLIFNGNISGTGSLTKEGAATLTLNGSNTYTGGTNINGGTLALGAGASLNASGVVNLAAGATFDLSAGNGTQSFGTLFGNGSIYLGANSLRIGGLTNGTFSGSIGGTGGLIKEGPGTTSLTGSNTYSGGTLINGGTLAIAAGGSLAASGAVTLTAAGTSFDISAGGNQAIGQLNGVAGATVNLGGNTLTLGGAGNGNYDGMIAGTGRLVKNGNGIQTLSGANTFSGGVTLNAGGLKLGNNGALGAGALTVARSASIDASTALNVGNDISLASGTALNLLGSNALTLGGPIYGLGGILKSGAGTLTLTGANSYTGGTTINAGTLAIGAGANLSSTGAVNLAGTGTLDISAGGNQTIGTLAGVAGSSVALGSNTLSFGSGNDSDFNGSIVGNGGLVKNGTGMQTLGGVSTFGGGVILNAGGLSVGNNAALGTGALTVSGNSTLEASSQVTLTNNVALNNASLTVSGSNNLNLNGIISGSGILLKDGSGTLTLNGINTNTGVTIINAGALRVSNANSSLMTVNNGATLIGTGSVGGTTVKNGATVHAETGTLTINGDYQQSTNGLLRVDVISATQYGKLDVSGIASFTANTKIDVDVKGGNTLANNNVLSNIIKAGTLNATTFAVTDNSALFNFEAILNSDSVDLRVLSASTTGISDAVREQGTGSAAGAANVLDGLLNGGASGDMATVVNAFGQLSNNRDVARAIAQTLPVISGNQSVQGALSTFQGLVQNRNSSSSGATGLSGGDAFTNKNAWGKVFGSRAEQDNRSGAAGFTADTWGLALGADAEVAPDARFGMAYGYAKTSVDGNTDLSGTAQRANIDSHVISAYGSKDIGDNRTFLFQGDIGLNNSKSTRYIDFGGLSRTARADYRTYSAHVGAAIAQAFELNEKTTLTPALRADYTWLKSQSYSESGADALNLNVGSNKTDAFVIGADTYLQHRFSKTSRLDANFGVGYDTIDKQGNIVAAYAGAPGQSFVTTGIDHSPWLVRGGIAYSLITTNGTEINFRYDAEGRSDFLNHTASVRAKWAF
ncbi:Outer membrane protein B precursor [compost metagenome]